MNSIKEILIQVEGFNNLSDDIYEKISSSCKILSYKIGYQILLSEVIPDNILIILEGEARLIGTNKGIKTTILKLKSGQIIGLASILRAKGCENISASEDTKVLSIPVKTFLDIYQSDESFQSWCNNYVSPAEILSLTEELIKQSPRSDINIRAAFQIIFKNCNLILDKIISDNSKESQYIYFLSSGGVNNKESWDTLNEDEKLETRSFSPARIFKLPLNIYNEFYNMSERNNNKEINKEYDKKIEDAPVSPSAISIDIGQYDPKQSFKLITAKGPIQESLACLQMLASFMDIPFRKDSIEKILRDEIRRGKQPSIYLIGSICRLLGLQANGGIIDSEFGTRLQVPSVIGWKGSFAIVKESSSKGIIIASPVSGIIEIKAEEIINEFPEGIQLLLIEKSISTPNNKFGINWFWPSLKKYKNVLFQVLIASFVVQLFGLANPLLIQVIIDKVISQRSLDTLQILGIALVVVTILGGVIGSLRSFLFTETTNRIDMRLASEVIDHLLRLPLGYFDNRPVGELGSRVAELEKIRNFLTGQALTTILDAAFSVIYIVVMLIYSWLLTLISLAVIPIQIGLTLLGAPLFRRQIREVAKENAKTQSHLVEVLTGVQTVKAQNVETVSRWKWQDLYTQYISRTFEKTITGVGLSETSKVLQQLSQLMVLWAGASLVLAGELSLGQLIAFRIISSYVTQPLLRLSTIWQNIQELKVSFERLADIIDTPQESNEADKANIPIPKVSGKVKFDNVSFAFNPSSPYVLENINLEIEEGTFVGIVGQSGSGKSTLMKLLPRLYIPNRGRIIVDNYDINKVELYSLRRQIGIVPQDPLLFSGTVSENIALSNPEASSDEIVEASKNANAHDFVMDLPNGYSSDVGERGSGLSGGQRQRIAIARTLLSKPNLLVLDEATSALDYDTENRVCSNLRSSCKGITVFFITHRLSTIKNSDIIIMMHQGSIAEKGTHEELMKLKGRYFALYQQQES